MRQFIRAEQMWMAVRAEERRRAAAEKAFLAVDALFERKRFEVRF
jgi:hypothetical protein